MKLKRLELRGFKTFAQATEFLFPSGITALVGPNGSGKSNVADAIRWVLAEQSLRAVRGKRTEDVIYAGGSTRSPSGMAEATITFDNSSGWLPAPYTELSITRRAYRSGENEYLLNGSRVRLRDLNELLLKAGLTESTFVVIGQGMVDLALSLRADERRSLIDEAADVKRFQVKLLETRERLAAMQQSLDRARDLLAEIEPRLKVLSDHADRYLRHQRISEELRRVQRRWHATVCRELGATRLDVEQRLAVTEQELSTARQEVEANAGQRSAGEAQLEESRRLCDDLQTSYERIRQQVEGLRRAKAVLAERKLAQSALRSELETGLNALEGSDESLRADIRRLAESSDTLHLAVDAEQGELDRDEQRRCGAPDDDELSRELSASSGKLQQLREKSAVLRDQSRRLAERLQEAEHEAARWRGAMSRSDARVSQVAAKITGVQAEIDQLRHEQESLGEEAARLGRDVAVQDDALQQLGGQARRLSRALDERRARIEILERWSEAQAYSAGVRAVLRAAIEHKGKPAQLSGVIGVAADLIRVPRELEMAIEVAMGGRAQDVVVERWTDADAAIALLKQDGAGRATFLPMDTLRAPSRANPFQSAAMDGIRGVASDLVVAETRYLSVVQHLLGRTLVVDTLPVARQSLRHCPPGWQIVTLEGEIVRANGAITGGARKGVEAGVLARQRELRELRQAVEGLEGELSGISSRLVDARAGQNERRQRAAEVERVRRELDARLRKVEAVLAELSTGRRSASDERRWAEAALKRQVAEEERARALLADVEAELQQVAVELPLAELRLHGLEEQQRDTALEAGRARESLAERRTALAAMQRELETSLARLHAREVDLASLSQRVQEQRGRLAGITETEAAIEAEAAMVESQLSAACDALEVMHKQLEPARIRADALGGDLRRLDKEALECREKLALAGARKREAESDLGRLLDQMTQAQQQSATDLGPAVAAEIWNTTAATEEYLALDALRKEMDELRSSLRAVGGVNPQAIEEQAATAERHDFLSRQVADMEEAAASLQRLSAELQRSVRQRFEQTFHAVGKEFRRYFTQLFGGGFARLSLADPSDAGQSGIEIIAQPPGRRLQNLSLLSGGERALTAVALLFAILAIRPMPFCVLDEVDAALDEANVGRFCEALRALAAETQFVVITHNRATMEIADNLYGITMPGDSSTQVVSLRLTGGDDTEELDDVQSFEPTATSRRQRTPHSG